MDSKLTTEETLRELVSNGNADWKGITDRFVDLIIDLIAERSEEKAEEVVDKHERDYDHDSWT